MTPGLLRRVQRLRPGALQDTDTATPPAIAGHAIVCGYGRVGGAHLLLLRIPERMAVRRALEHAREVSKATTVLARTHSYEDRSFLHAMGADEAVVGEMELALELGSRALQRFGVRPDVIERSIAEARRTLA